MAKPLWISHRGLRVSGAVENTVEAYRAAVAAGFTALETDLRLTSDGHIVLHHDPHLARLGNDPRQIAGLTRAELTRVRLGGGDARLLFFEDFLEEFAGCSWTFDVKVETGEPLLRSLFGLAKARGLTDWLRAQARWLTWSARHEALLGELFPGAVTYAREPECWRAGLSVLCRVPGLAGVRRGRTYALPPSLGGVRFYRSDFVGAFHAREARVVAFLPETEPDTRAAIEAGVDEILTNGTILKATPLTA